MHIAHWLWLVAMVGSCAVSIYFIYAGLVAFRQLASVDAVSFGSVALLVFGIVLLAFCAWRLWRAVVTLRAFRSCYHAHAGASEKA